VLKPARRWQQRPCRSAVLAGIGLAHPGAAKIVVVMVGLDVFIASLATGVGGTGWLIQGESFPVQSAARPRRSPPQRS
jgi:MFS transporter, SP family, arabinose:H+ symporter